MEVAPSGKPPDRVPVGASPTAPSAPADPVQDDHELQAAPRIEVGDDPRRAVPSSLKFTISAADVDATFSIHEELRRVMVTMTDSTSGEVLRQTPPKAIVDTIVALRSKGLLVDVSS